jgi:KDO2-lipid IV(A) lauroyltransferase
MKNLRNSFPEKSEKELRVIEKQFYQNLADISIETLKGISISRKELEKRMVLQSNMIEELMTLGKPIIIMTSHFGNWEWALLAISHFHTIAIHAVYQKLRNPFFDKLMLELRSRFGAIMHEKNSVVTEMSQISRKPYVLAMVSDQKPFSGERKYWASFMNQDAAFYSGAEILARRMDIPVVYLSVNRTRRGYYEFSYQLITTEPRLLERNEITNAFIRLTESDIRKDPSSYLWSHNRWKHKKPIELN